MRFCFVAGIVLLGTTACQRTGETTPQPSPQSYEAIFGTIAIEGSRSVVSAARVGPTFFREAKVLPMLGRAIIDTDSSNGSPVVVLSEKEWREVFHADPSVIGKVIQIDDRPRTIVGIMPKSLDFPAGSVFWIPK